MSQRDLPEVNGLAPLRCHGMWSTVQAAITGGWGTTFRLLLILGGLATLMVLAGHGVGTPILALFRLIR